jgi:pimeloyl-ACP methyl ester carboxylesterase
LVVASILVSAACGNPSGRAAPAVEGVNNTMATDSTAIRPFKIHVPDSVLTDLRERLAKTRFPDEIEGANWDYGTPVGYLKDLTAYWREKFDWRKQEQLLNSFEQFKTRIGDLDIHFIHQRSPDKNAIPLLITHGWPGSIAEFTKIIGPLTDPVKYGGRAEDAFHVVAASMPGYGFSDKPRQRGFGPPRVADVNAQLMARLGYQKYGLQGGDWGAIVSRWHAFRYPAPVIGLHLNMIVAAAPTGGNPEEGVPPSDLARTRERQALYAADEIGYAQIQGTRPQSLGYGLNDSPAGQAAWIVEKFRNWCDCSGNPETILTKDELLTNITLYWVTETGPSSARMYYENRHAPPPQPIGRVTVPTGAAVFPHEIMIPPRRWAEAAYNIVHWTEMPRGGHFAAMEQPELLVKDIREFFARLR